MDAIYSVNFDFNTGPWVRYVCVPVTKTFFGPDKYIDPRRRPPPCNSGVPIRSNGIRKTIELNRTQYKPSRMKRHVRFESRPELD